MPDDKRTGVWMKLYVSDWIGKTLLMGPAARGCYINLLAHAWKEGSIPADRALQARICACTADEMEAAWEHLECKWIPVEGNPRLLQNSKQERVRADQDGRLAKAQAGGHGRWKDTTPEERKQAMAEVTAQSAKVRRERASVLVSVPGASPTASERACPERGDSRTRDSRTQGTGNRDPGPNQNARRPRLDGSSELRQAVEAWETENGPMGSDLIAGLEQYREARVEMRAPPWSKDKWVANLNQCKGDQAAMLRGIENAVIGGHKKIYPRFENGQAQSTEDKLAEIRREMTA